MNNPRTHPSDVPSDLPPNRLLAEIGARTPARLFTGRAGTAYRTTTQLDLRSDHAAAVDAVHAEFQLLRDLGPACVSQFRLFEVSTLVHDRREFLLRPDRGRRLDDEARQQLRARCPRQVDLQVVIGDGLSVAAVRRQVPDLLPLLQEHASRVGWTWGQPFAIRNCRVGVMNDVGAELQPEVIVLLIGERPGLATAESLSAYMAFQPQPGHTDAQRNLISNIHARGVPPDQAASRIIALAEAMRRTQRSGIDVKEEFVERLEDGRANSPSDT